MVAILDWNSKYILSLQLSQTLKLNFVLGAFEGHFAESYSMTGIMTMAVTSQIRSISTVCWSPWFRSIWMVGDLPETTALTNSCGDRQFRGSQFTRVHQSEGGISWIIAIYLYTICECPYQVPDYQIPAQVYCMSLLVVNFTFQVETVKTLIFQHSLNWPVSNFKENLNHHKEPNKSLQSNISYVERSYRFATDAGSWFFHHLQ